MTEHQLKSFLQACRDDAGLRVRLSTAKSAEDAVSIAKAAGFSIEPSELLAASRGRPTRNSIALLLVKTMAILLSVISWKIRIAKSSIDPLRLADDERFIDWCLQAGFLGGI